MIDKEYIFQYYKGTGYNAVDTVKGLIKEGGYNGFDESDDGSLTVIYYDFGAVVIGSSVFEIVDSCKTSI